MANRWCTCTTLQLDPLWLLLALIEVSDAQLGYERWWRMRERAIHWKVVHPP